MREPFIPTHDWQDVPDGTVLPPGCQIQVNVTTGRTQARRLNGAGTARHIDTAIPAIAELAALGARFVTWRYEPGENGKPTKVPYRVFGDIKAATDKPASWGTFAEACNALNTRTDRDGIGFVPRPAEDGIIVVDLDGCIDPASGEIADWAQRAVDDLNSYTEMSPSGAGLKVFARAAPVPQFPRKTRAIDDAPKYCEKEPQFEVLGIGNRYTTLTGLHFGGTPVEIRDATDALLALAEWMARPPAGSKGNPHSRRSPWPSDMLMRTAETIPNDDLPWDEWNNTAMRFWAASDGSKEGFAAFDAFSAKSDKYDARATRNRWAGITVSPPTQYNKNSLLIHARKFDGSFPDPFRQVPPDSDRPVRECLNKKQAGSSAENQSAWPEPIPLFAEHEKPEPYPIDALPPSMRAAVETYQGFGQQPIELVASSALSAASLVCQALADVDRDGNLSGPCSLSIITVGVSGERKTAADKRMRRALVAWQEEKRKEQAPAIEAAERRLSIWEARRDGMMGKIKRLSSSTKIEDEADRRALEEELVRFDLERPRVPPTIRLFYEDVTPERLASSLAEGWPSSSLWSDEGGLVIGSHAMSEDVALRFLALLHRLWDGNPFDRDRETRSCAHIRGRRFTASLMLQPGALAKLVSAGNGIARVVGALARYLVAWPTSTMGTRLYKSGDSNDPALCAFDARLHSLLDMPLPLDEDGALHPPVLRLDSAAFEVWRQLHDDVERELGSRGEFTELPDFGAKIAEQGARIACVLQVFQNGPVGQIGHEMMLAGAKIALWHLHEARRVLGMIGHAGEAADAQALLEWLAERPEPATLRDIQRGLYRMHDKDRRDRAVTLLVDHGLARVVKHGQSEKIVLSPAARS